MVNLRHNKIIFGMILAGIVITSSLLNGCEQPEIQNGESLPAKNNDQNILNKDSIESWDADTTTYHSQALPNT